jgi:hypothetical protein
VRQLVFVLVFFSALLLLFTVLLAVATLHKRFLVGFTLFLLAMAALWAHERRNRS